MASSDEPQNLLLELPPELLDQILAQLGLRYGRHGRHDQLIWDYRGRHDLLRLGSNERNGREVHVANAAREVVQFAIRQLDRGLSDHYVRNAAGRLIVYGFAHGVYIGFPGERQFEWEYALSGLQALDPENF